jgi:hypothetical protein
VVREILQQSDPAKIGFQRSDPGMIGGGDSPSPWATAIAPFRQLVMAFLATLARFGCFDAMLPFMVRLPFRSQIIVSSSVITGAGTAEAENKPVGDLSLSAEQLDVEKTIAMLVASDELLRVAAAADLVIETELRQAIVSGVDQTYLQKLVAATSPIASTGNVLEDLSNLLEAIEIGADAALFFVVPVSAAKQLATMSTATGDMAFPTMGPLAGSIANVCVLASEQLTNTAVLVDATQIGSVSEGMTINASAQADIIMNAGSSPETTVSLWQKNLRAIRAERWWNAIVLRTSAVASLSGVGYQGGSPS